MMHMGKKAGPIEKEQADRMRQRNKIKEWQRPVEREQQRGK